VANRRMARALTPFVHLLLPIVLPGLYPSDVQAGNGSLDLTRKGSGSNPVAPTTWPLTSREASTTDDTT
jgi:hypothetical protein